MTKSKKTKEISLLLQQWAFEVGNHLCCDKGFPRKKAFRRAYAVQRCLEALGSGKVRLRYYKKDGTLREARGTLCRQMSAAFAAYEYVKTVEEVVWPCATFTYWDMDREAFRTFSADRLIEVISEK